MSSALKLTLAVERYDRHVPFFDGTLSLPEGIELDVKQVGQSKGHRDGAERHGRMIHGNEFDICEFSLSSFLMAKAWGLPLTGVPVFPRRLFSQSQMWVSTNSDYGHPKELLGKKVAVSSFQTTLSLLAKGDLKFYYDVPWEEIHWLTTTDEKLKFEPKPGVKVDYIGGLETIGEKLESGEADAFFLPQPPLLVMTKAGSEEAPARRLFADCRAEERDYYKKFGDFPIMHVVAIREDLAREEPWLANAVIDLFDQAKEIAAGYYADPNWSQLAWGRHNFEEERSFFKNDPWQNGFQNNRATLERFIKYSHDQGLIESVYPPETLFAEETLDS